MIAQLDAAAQTTITHWVLNQGPWFVMYLLLLYALWRGCKAVFNGALMPLKDAAIEHLKSVSTHFDGLSTSMTKLGTTCDKISEKLVDIDTKTTILCEEYKGFVDESVDDRKKIHERLDSIEQKIGQMPKLPMP